jgi:hypothetical protein
LATQFFNCNKDTTKNVVLFYIFVPYCWAISFGILSTFEDLYTKYYRSFSHKSEKYLCFKELKEVLPNLKLKVEDQITDYFHNELLQIFKENDSLIKESVSLMKDKTLLKKYRGILRQNNVWFEDEIKNEETKKQNSQNLPKHSIKETKTFSSSSYNLLGLSEPIQRTRQTQPIEKDNQIEKTSTDVVKLF